MQTTRTGQIPPYLGAALTDRYTRGVHPIDVCGLTLVGPGRLEAEYWHWFWDPGDGALNAAAVADEVTGTVCTLIDGPQGVAAADQPRRECERLVRPPEPAPGAAPLAERFTPGLIRSSTALFRALHDAGVVVSPPGFLRGVGEIAPAALWPLLAQRLLPPKGTTGGQVARRAVLQALGVQHLPSLTSHDQADACLAALFAAAADGQVPGLTVGALGRALEVDSDGTLREGPIAMPAKIESRLQERIDRAIAQPAAQGVIEPAVLARATMTIDLAKVRVEAPSMKPQAPKPPKRSPAPKTPSAPPAPASPATPPATPDHAPRTQAKITRRPSTDALSKPAAPPFAPKKPLENRPGPKATPAPKPKAKSAPKPKAKPAPKPKAKPAPKPTAKPAPKPKAKPAPKPKTKPAPKKRPKKTKKKAASAKKAAPKKRVATQTPPKQAAPRKPRAKKPTAKKPAAKKPTRRKPGTPPPRSGSRAIRAQALLDWMVKEARAGRPVVCTYAWLHRHCLGGYAHWSGARTKAVRTLGGSTKARACGSLGKVRLDCFTVARATRRAAGPYKRGAWTKLLGKARLLA